MQQAETDQATNAFPMTSELARAAKERGRWFTSRVPEILGQFDDGDECATVVIVGPGATEGTVRTRVPGTKTGGIFDVALETVTIGEEYVKHLDLAAGYIVQKDWMLSHPRQGRRAHVCNPALH